MRVIETKVFKFNELSEKAKDVARDWWRNAESSDPAWIDEHRESMHAAIKELKGCLDLDDWQDILVESSLCKWTGYCADAILADNASEDELPSESEIREWYQSAWDREMSDRMSDSSVDENIIANDYEFTEYGRII